MTQDSSPNLIPISKLSLNQILGASLSSLRRIPKVMLGTGLIAGFVVGISTIIITALLVRSGADLTINSLPDPTKTITQAQIEEFIKAITPTLIVAAITSIVLFFAQSITSVIFIHTINNAITGKKLTSSEALEKAKPQFLKFLGLSIISFFLPLLAVLLIFIAGLIIGNTIGGQIGSLVTISGLSAGIIVGIYIWVILSVAGPSLVLENSSIIVALKRSNFLIKNMFFRVLGISIVGIISAQAISIVASTPFSIFAGTSSEDGVASTSSVFLTALGSISGYTFMLPFAAAFTTFLYTDLKIRKEEPANQLSEVKD